ncbi:hypothetical protein AAG570_008601 [Ranatra chinensis]|uniref:Uncharacterized protein n=1 Tax=Ranatra chinensis TaxID=642074 RepID=A0ABD0Z8G6_9HEMI
MASKLQNKFYQNKKQETTELGEILRHLPRRAILFLIHLYNSVLRTTYFPLLWIFSTTKHNDNFVWIVPEYIKTSIKGSPLDDDPRSGWGYGAVRGSGGVEGTGRDAEWSWHGWWYGRRVSSAPAEETTRAEEKTAPGGDLPEGEERIRVRMVTLPEEEGGLKCTPGERLTVTSESEGVVWVVGRILACTPERDHDGKPQVSVTMEITEVEEFFHWMSGKNEEQKCDYDEKSHAYN